VNTAQGNPNLTQLLQAARKLQPLLEQIVFVGGCATALLVTDPAASPVRPTFDVDAIVEIATYAEYTQLEDRLRQLGFSGSKDMICRWTVDGLVLDLMPADPTILGFSNRWYGPALKNATSIRLNELVIRLISAPYFLGTKLVAFQNRGKGDYAGSRDMEDIITVMDGRPEIIREILGSDREIQVFLHAQFRMLLDAREFIGALSGFLLPDAASQQRATLVLDRMRQIAKGGKLRGPR
jgi:hypothetical protein